MKLIKLFGILMSMSLVFLSCSKDDDNNNNGNGPSSGIKKKLKSIDDDGYLTTFYYADGKITRSVMSHTSDYNGETYYNNKDIKYFDSKIEIQDGGKTITYNLTNGLVTRITDGEDYEDITYENGRIKTWKKYYKGELDEDILFEWKNDVITHQRELDEYGTLSRDFYYTYTNNIDYGGIIASFQSDSFFYDNLPESLILQGYFGTLPKYLVAEINDMVPDGFGKNNFSYVMDEDGYPTTMTWTLSGGYSIATYFVWE